MISRWLMKLARVASLVLLAGLGTIALTRFAPGYFSDAREMDGLYAEQARVAMAARKEEQGAIARLMGGVLRGWMRGDMGRSRQYDVPVRELIAERVRVTGRLLSMSVASGWLVACVLALALSARRGAVGEALLALVTALLLSVPIGAMATACLIANMGGPFAVLATVIAVRDFKLVYRLLCESRKASHLAFARAQGMTAGRIVWVHLLPAVRGEVLALGMVSFLTALSAIVPVEVIFDVPGLGQLAWSAAMNRDLPVLLGVTVLMAAAVGVASTMSQPVHREAAQ